MIVLLFCVASLLLEPGSQAAPARSLSDGMLAAAAREVFAHKCVECHGSDLAHPRAGFGYVTDLSRLTAHGKYVVPGKLGDSVLWQEIDEGDMPPENAKAGALTAQETEAVREWILGGAPALEKEGAPGARAPRERLIVLIGRLHVLAVHFPVALLVIAALCEAWEGLGGAGRVSPSVRFCLSVGAVGAVAAAGLGWVRALDGFSGPLSDPASLVGLHRWIGTGVGVTAPIVALFSERELRHGERSRGVRAAVVALGVLAGAAAHFGGLLTHGTDFFDL
jgi:hypothetical protein